MTSDNIDTAFNIPRKEVSFENIKALYENPDLLLDASENAHGRNIAVDISARTKVIQLRDARIHYSKGELYIPGESYVLTFKQAEKTVKSRLKVFHRGRNIFPGIIDTFIEGNDPRRIYRNADATDVAILENWMKEKGKKEIAHFIHVSNSRKNNVGKIDPEGLVILEQLDPITPLTHGYELNGVYHAHDHIGRLNPPLEILAYEAEIGFASTDHAKITDSEGKIGKFHDGILTLCNPSFIVHNILSENENSKGLLQGFYQGAMVGGALGLVVSIALALRGRHYIGAGIAITASIAGGIVNSYRRYQEKKSYPSGTHLMRISFNGTVKDKRFEHLEDILE